MPPRRGESIERNDAYDSFIDTVTKYHEARGTTFDPEPKVGVRHIDLLKLYRRVTEEGGYDLVSDRDAKPLMWRKLAEEFVGKNQYTAAQAFQIKNVYYKNLCAYEISTHWGKEPPPKEILEEVTAKGGNVMSRTLENFARPSSREQVNLENGDASDNSPEQGTPEKEKPEEDSNGATARTRGLRQQPPQRVLFQPDLTSARQSRSQTSAAYGSPTPTGPGTNGVMNTASWASGASSTLASYEPSQSYPLSLKPATTPANNPEFYRLERKRKLEANAGPLAKKYKNIMLPGTGFIGPSIYVRAQLALQCGIPEEEQYALHHLVKISHERGDKYRFDQFPGLAEALVRKALQISSLFYDVEWDVTYDEDSGTLDDEVLNGLHGTSDIIQRLRSKIPLVSNDSIQDADFLSKVNRITEAGLILRNMSMHDDNAKYLSLQPITRDYLAIVLNLPQHSSIVELQHYALETAEQILKHCDIGSHDALYHSLLMQLDREDRGAVTLALRAISRIAMHLKLPKRLDDISDNTLQKAQDWLMVEDEELRTACLDFLMQYTSFAGNVDNLLQAVDAERLVRHLSRLLFSGAKEHKEQRAPPRLDNDDASVGPVPRLSRSVVEALLKLEEPERSSEWLRMCFLPDLNSEMTQISLWQAYQATFSAFHATHPHLIAGDFIKNVSNTFMGATAQVAGSNKYVIRGIKPRKVPVDASVLSGVRTNDKPKELQKCCWRVSTTVESPRDPLTGMQGPPMTREGECAEWFRDGRDLLKHILNTHLRIPSKKVEAVKHEESMETDSNSTPVDSTVSQKLTNGTGTDALGNNFDFQAADNATYHCRWSNCTRTSQDYDASKTPRTLLLARHIQTHLPDASSAKNEHNLTPQSDRQLASSGTSYMTSLQDEKNDAAGVPLGAALVLRNIAKFMPQQTSAVSAAEGMREVLGGEKSGHSDQDKDTLIANVFNESVQDTLFYAFAHQRTVRDYVGYILRAIRASGG